MAKRGVAAFLLLCVILGTLSVKLMMIGESEAKKIDSSSGSLSLVVSQTRGTIYDCNMVRLVNNTKTYTAVAKPDATAVEALRACLDSDSFASLYERMSRGNPVMTKVDSPDISNDSINIFETFERYSERQTAAHIIGYTDSDGNGVSGIEKSFNELLSNSKGECIARVNTDAYGRTLMGCEIEVKDTTHNSNAGVCLTIDSTIQAIAERAAEECGLTKGAVVVLDADTGEIRAMVSNPVYDVNDIHESLSAENQPFINRAITPYSVGSVFKCFVAAAAFEQADYSGLMYECTGKTELDSIVFNCHEHDGHGLQNLENALVNSCNPYFINLVEKLNRQELLDCLTAFNFGLQTELAPGLISAAGNLQNFENLTRGEAANLSFGQGSLLATPLQIASASACLINGGIFRDAVLVKGTVDAEGVLTVPEKTALDRRVVSEHTANTIKKYMVSVVELGSGRAGKPVNCTAGGKTATAQSGIYENGKEVLQTWFSGFFPADNPEYVVTVLREDGISGAVDCAPVFKQIAEEIYALR